MVDTPCKQLRDSCRLGGGWCARLGRCGSRQAQTNPGLRDGCLSWSSYLPARRRSRGSHRLAGAVEVMDVDVSGLPSNTDFDFFVIQVPHSPFRMSWYQGDIETNKHGRGHETFIGRFNTETFIVAPGSAPAPVVHQGPFPDASLNPPVNPIHTFHLGLWFNSPNDAAGAGCASTVTPFNGEHNAGIQVLNTSNFADDQGPLRALSP